MSDTSTGGGFDNVIKGFEHLPAHIREWFTAQENAHPSMKAAVDLLKNSLATLAAEIEQKGLPVVKQAAVALSVEIAGALTGTTSKGAAGTAAISTVKTTVSTLTDDALHILVTDLLTDVAAVAGPASSAPAA